MNTFYVLLVCFIVFFVTLITLTKREEKLESQLSPAFQTEGNLKTVTVKKRVVRNEEAYTVYTATYTYYVDNRTYKTSADYQIDMNDQVTQIPKKVTIYYLESKPSFAKVYTLMEQRDSTKGFLPSFIVAFLVFLILTHFFIAPII
ncbi:hypothetical protein [Floccifex sp.]|uniref:hypothetical protein n=1 Tax=Floccifex sp. TaxID=2815810 RepID=UPI003F126DB6